MDTNKIQKSGVAIASLILGIISFIPAVGILLGIIAIILGIIALSQIRKREFSGKGLAITGIILGVLGIIFSILLYGSLFYYGFIAKSGPFTEIKVKVSKMTLTQDAGLLELYKKKYGKYPESLEEARKAGFQIYGMDHYLKPFYYKVSNNGQSYELRSLGPDGIYGTADDIFPEK